MRNFLFEADWKIHAVNKDYWMQKIRRNNIWSTIEYDNESDVIRLECYHKDDLKPEFIILELDNIQDIFNAIDQLTDYPDD